MSPSFVVILVICFVYSFDMFLNQLDFIYFGEHISTIPFRCFSSIIFSFWALSLSAWSLLPCLYTHTIAILSDCLSLVYQLSLSHEEEKSHSLFIQPALYILSTTWPAIWQIELLNDKAVLIALVAALSNVFFTNTMQVSEFVPCVTLLESDLYQTCLFLSTIIV